MIINNEMEKFLELFDKVFSEEEENTDNEDGLVLDICTKVAQKVKESLKNADKTKLLNFFLNFIKDIFIKKKDTNGEN